MWSFFASPLRVKKQTVLMMVMSPMCCYFTHQQCRAVVRLEAHHTNCMFSWKSKLPGLELKEELWKKNRSFPSRHERTWTRAGLHSWACWPDQEKCIPSTFRSGVELLPPQRTRSHPLQRHRGSTFPEHTPHSQIFMPKTPQLKSPISCYHTRQLCKRSGGGGGGGARSKRQSEFF